MQTRRNFLAFMGILVPGWYGLSRMQTRLDAIGDEEEEESESSSSLESTSISTSGLEPLCVKCQTYDVAVIKGNSQRGRVLNLQCQKCGYKFDIRLC